MAEFRVLMGLLGSGVDGMGVMIIILGVIMATYRYVFGTKEGSYRTYAGARAVQSCSDSNFSLPATLSGRSLSPLPLKMALFRP